MEQQSIHKLTVWKMTNLKLKDRRSDEIITKNFYISENDKECAIDSIFDYVDQLGYDHCTYENMTCKHLEINLTLAYETSSEIANPWNE